MLASLALAASLVVPPACPCGASHEDWVAHLPEVVRTIAEDVQANPPPPDAAAILIDAQRQKELDADTKLGKDIAEQVRKELKMSSSPAFVDRVKRIGARLADIANQNHIEAPWGDKKPTRFEYNFEVIEGDDVNAFSLPGGYIFVYEGLIRYAETDHELAGVLAHEIAHASFRHVATLQREQSKMQSITIPLILVSLLSGSDAGQKAAIGTSLVEQAVGSGWSVQAERAADFGGFRYMQLSPYAPVGLLTFMERLAFDERNRPKIDWGIYRSHPPSRERADTLKGMMEAAGLPLERSLSSTSFRAIPVVELDQSVSVRVLGRKLFTLHGPDAEARAEVAAPKISRFLDQLPDLFEVTTRDNAIKGFGSPLIEFKDADAEAAKLTMKELTDAVNRELKSALFQLRERTNFVDRSRPGSLGPR